MRLIYIKFCSYYDFDWMKALCIVALSFYFCHLYFCPFIYLGRDSMIRKKMCVLRLHQLGTTLYCGASLSPQPSTCVVLRVIAS